MLAGDRAAHLNAHLEDAAGQGLGPLECSLLSAIIDNQRMQVTVAGVEDVGTAHTRLGRKLADVTQGLAEPAPRHHTVLDNEVG